MPVPTKLLTDAASPRELRGLRKKSFMLADSINPLEVCVHRTAWRDIDFDYPQIKRRATYATIWVGQSHAGSLTLYEYRPEMFISPEYFWQIMDDASAASGELAEVVTAHWEEVGEISDYGDIMEINRVWMHPKHSGRGRLAKVLHELPPALGMDPALLILKAFPLQFEGKVTEDNADAFERRRLAMMRLYRNMLSVDAFPGQAGARGWMYRIPDRLSDIIAPPRTERPASGLAD